MNDIHIQTNGRQEHSFGTMYNQNRIHILWSVPVFFQDVYYPSNRKRMRANRAHNMYNNSQTAPKYYD